MAKLRLTLTLLTALVLGVISSNDIVKKNRMSDGFCKKSGAPLNILLTNDDGFESANIQALFTVLETAGHNVTMSAPLFPQSATSALLEYGSRFFFLPDMKTAEPSPNNTIPAGSPLMGRTTLGANQYYIDSVPTTAVYYGLDVLFAESGMTPDIVISGPNTLWNMGIVVPHSGTVGAAVTALNRGVPSVAISVDGDRSDDEYNPSGYNPDTIAQLTLKILNTINCEGGISLPDSTGLNVNIPRTMTTTVNDFTFRVTKIGKATKYEPMFYSDVKQCPDVTDQDALPDGVSGICRRLYDLTSDTDKHSEYNVFSGQSNVVTISPIQGTYQSERGVYKKVKNTLGALL